MKVIHLSDTHLVPPGQGLHGYDPLQRCTQMLQHVHTHHADADAVILSGDLTHSGQAQAYQALQTLIAAQALPIHLMLGNHDSRAAFGQHWPETLRLGDGFAQQVVRLDGLRLLLLDTLDEGKASGHLCQQRLDWLSNALADSQGEPVYVFLHHPPFSVGMTAVDQTQLDNADALDERLRPHANVAHLFCGHVHRHISGVWRGLPFSTVKGSNHQTALRLGVQAHAHSRDSAGYAVILARQDTIAVHYQDLIDGA